MAQQQIHRAVEQRHFTALHRAVAHQRDVALPAALSQRLNNALHTAARRVKRRQFRVVRQQFTRNPARRFRVLKAAHRFQHTLAAHLLTQVGAKTDLAGFLASKTVVADDHADVALTPAQTIHRPAGGAARFLIIQTDVAGAAGHR